MNPSVHKVLIIGGGFSGMTAAIEFRKRNIDVHLVEIDPNWRTDGAGISIGGATLRAFKTIGILDEFLKVGHAHSGLDLFAPHGIHIAKLPTPLIGDKDIPASGAIMRPALAKILAEKTRASGTKVKLGCTYTQMINSATGVDVTFTDGTTDTYDLVVAADGVFSSVRKSHFPEAGEPRYVGQGVWRAVLPRLPNVENTMMWVGPHLKVGVNPMSKDQMYLFLTEDKKERQQVDPADYVEKLRALMLTFSAPMIQELAAMLNEDSMIDFRSLGNLLVPAPWYKNRIVMIGDTVAATTPHLASGACIGIESAIVLAEELCKDVSVDEGLAAFQQRRWDRCRMVVENSGRLAQIEIEGGDKAEHTAIMRESMMALAQPI
ncbi:MAG: FAD-dependent oxidoreductase [Paraglaciecola sp.]|uniref:FAD-dependent oxidoreductase n=1 Tax=Paraglaciecola sp. TaxID=1920173 RepID=UPI00273FC76B|nr:FAD-dependent oxidoreductase [Paraglaciecola sp.]MDP5033036.1 FAD-dependent oxidoreductase [Paraglaciecola sp.]MDP5133721.1 FAD-dependent oxidoreductase [Paraglaciecola sp.]